MSVAMSDKRNLPTLRIKEEIIPLEAYIKKWVAAYLRGYKNRPSVRVGKKSATIPDSLVNEIIKLRIEGISDSLANKVESGHSLSMTIENLMGDLLEEYLSLKLAPFGWYCCWGSTIDAVDFCKRDGSLLQVKNSNNSENSSSSKVRIGTDIDKWFRRFSCKEDCYNWGKLKALIDQDICNEEDFRSYVRDIIRTNPNCIYVDPSNLLLVNSNN